MRYYIQDELSQDYYYTTIQENEIDDFFHDIIEEYGENVQIVSNHDTIIIR